MMLTTDEKGMDFMKQTIKHAGLVLLLGAAQTALPDEWHLVPQPNQIASKSGAFAFTQATRINSDGTPGAREVARLTAEQLRQATGYSLPVTESAQPSKDALTFCKGEASLGREGYTLEVGPDGITCTATGFAGFFYAWQTLRQLLPAEVFSAGKASAATEWRVPGVSIRDVPRFSWRGLLIDECRHFFGKEALRKQLDLMAVHKLNVLHWHLTEDQGWRIEIKKYPELVLKGAVRDESPAKGNRKVSDKTAYGPFYYTQEDIRELVAYARVRNITIVPEIEMPGHAMAVFSAYPELMCKPRENVRPRWQWGVEEDVFCAGNDQTLRFLEAVLDEVIPLFDSEFIHIGGDECPKERWKACPKCQARIKACGLKDEHHLQSWFVQHFTAYIAKKGRRAIGWDEILEGGLPKGAAVMSWRGMKGGLEAARAGHEVVMTPNTHLYFDYGQAEKDPGCEYIGGLLPLEKVYGFDPVAGLPDELHRYILGCQGNNWTEFTWTPAELEWKAYPRACALAEVAWTQAGCKSWERFSAAWKQAHSKRLDSMRVNYYRPDGADAEKGKSK